MVLEYSSANGKRAIFLPVIEDAAQNAEFPKQLLKGLADKGCLWPIHS